jgi:hypothetical protein
MEIFYSCDFDKQGFMRVFKAFFFGYSMQRPNVSKSLDDLEACLNKLEQLSDGGVGASIDVKWPSFFKSGTKNRTSKVLITQIFYDNDTDSYDYYQMQKSGELGLYVSAGQKLDVYRELGKTYANG